jgi:hypothetical protein
MHAYALAHAQSVGTNLNYMSSQMTRLDEGEVFRSFLRITYFETCIGGISYGQSMEPIPHIDYSGVVPRE